MDSKIDINGQLNYGNEKLLYNFKVYANLFLEKIGHAVKMLNEYKPHGNIKAEYNITDQNLIKGKTQFINVGAFTSKLGYFTDINSNIIINSVNDIKVKKLTGQLNKNKFLTEASYLIEKKHGNISLLFRAKKIFAELKDDTNKDNSIKKEKVTNEKTKEWPLPPLNVKMDFMVEDIDAPYFMGKNIIFKMNLANVTPSLNEVKGNMNLQCGQGTIKDLYKLTNSNAIMKGLFLSLDIVSKVINALNVLDILNSIGSALFSSDTNISSTTTNQPEKKQSLDGKLDFDSFVTSLNFTDGKADFEKCNFISNLLSFKVEGNINFKEDKLDMTVNAAPGKHEVDGIMPLTMTIDGTVEKPTGSLSLLGTVSAIVTDSLLKNVVSDSLKKGFVGLLGLKKHDEKGNEIQEKVNTSTTTNIQNITSPTTIK